MSARVRLFPILLVNFIGTLGFSIVIPFLVVLVDRFGGSALAYGLMGATYSAFQLVGAPVLGRWSDVFGRRKILLVSQLGTLFSWCVFLTALFLPLTAVFERDVLGLGTLSVPLLVLFAARALDGLTGGNVSVANAYLADVSEPQSRKTNFGKMAVAGNLGFILGPTLAGLLGATRFGEILPVATALGISAAASLLIAFYLPESKTCAPSDIPEPDDVHKVFGQEQKDCYSHEGESKKSWRDALARKRVPFLLTLYFIIFLGFNLFYTAFPVHAVRGLDWSITEIGVFFSYLGLTTVLVQGPILARIGDRVSDRTLTVVGSGILAASFLAFTSPTGLVLYAGATAFSLGNGLMWPSFMALLSNAAGDDLQGAVQGFGSSVGSLASILGLISGGIAYDRVGASTFFGSAALIALVVVLSLKLPSD